MDAKKRTGGAGLDLVGRRLSRVGTHRVSPTMSKATESLEETNFPQSYGQVDRYGESKASILSFHEMRRKQPQTVAAIWHATADETKLKILRVVCLNNVGVGYERLCNAVNKTKRTIRTKVKELVDAGILDKSGRPAQITFTDQTTRALTNDILHVIDNANTNTATA